MRSVVPDYLIEALGDVEADRSGELAGYIPELATADPERLAAVFATVDGEIYGAGDSDVEFTIQSISKPFAYALALPIAVSTPCSPRSVSSRRGRRSTRSPWRQTPVGPSTP